jgi:hypothetical protein
MAKYISIYIFEIKLKIIPPKRKKHNILNRNFYYFSLFYKISHSNKNPDEFINKTYCNIHI